MKISKRQSGITLIEILVVMFISTIAGGLLLVIMTNSSGLFFKESSKINQGVGVNDALVALRQNIKQANSIVSSFSSESTVFTSGQDQLILGVSSVDNAGNIIPNTNDYFVFFKDQNILRLKVFPNELSHRKSVDQVLTTSVNGLLFEYFDNANPPVQVAPNAASKIKATLILGQTIATSEANLRND